MTGPRMRNQPGEFKKEMVCGKCGYKGRTENLKKQHLFPKKNPENFTLKRMTLKDLTISSICQD